METRFLAAVIVLALAAPAAAQEASFAVSQADVPVGLEVDAGSTTSIAFDVNLTGEGFSCAADVEAPVNATLAADVPSSPENASVDPGNASKAFPIPAGDYHTQTYNQSTRAEVDVAVGGGVSENYTATLSLTSTFPGGTYQDCVPSEFPEASSETAEIRLDVVADEPEEEPEADDGTQPPANETNETDTNGSDGDNTSTEDENGLPVPWQIAPLGLVAAALACRASREA